MSVVMRRQVLIGDASGMAVVMGFNIALILRVVWLNLTLKEVFCKKEWLQVLHGLFPM